MQRHEFLILLTLILLIAVPFFVNPYWIRVLTSVLMFSSLVLAQNVLLGYTGYPAFGGIAFFGMGGYSTAILMKQGVPFTASLLAGGLISLLFALFLAPFLMRLKSHYFAITTLALQLALMEITNNLEFTGGSHGINLPIYRGEEGPVVFFFAFWLLTLLAYLVNVYIDRSTFGWALKAIREDEVSAETLGVNTVMFKSVSFAIMGWLTATAGGIYAYWITYIDPASMFDPVLSVKVFVALLIGGVGTTWGPLAGAFGLEIISEVVWGTFFELHGVVLGALIILTILLIPGGISALRRV